MDHSLLRTLPQMALDRHRSLLDEAAATRLVRSSQERRLPGGGPLRIVRAQLAFALFALATWLAPR